MANAHPEMIDAIVFQNANAYEVGLSPLWPVRRAFWEDRPAHEAALRANFISREAARQRNVGTSPHPEYIDGKDVPSAEIHILDAGHFALDQRADEVARLTKDFLDWQKR